MTDRAPWTGCFLVLLAIAILFLTRQYAEGQAMPDPLPQRTSDAGAMSNDPLQVCARKALAGTYGTLRPWQLDAYEWVIAKGVTCCGKAKLTSYGYKWEPAWLAGGRWTASDSHVHLAGCAANPEIPFGTLIWTSYGLRYVTDRGGWVKVNRRFTSRAETANLDYYTWESWPTKRNTPWAIVKRHTETDKGTWHRKGRSELP